MWSFGAFPVCKKTPYISETAGRRAKRTFIWASGMSSQCILVSQVPKVILVSFGAFPIFDNLVSQKCLVVEQNGVNLWPQG